MLVLEITLVARKLATKVSGTFVILETDLLISVNFCKKISKMSQSEL
jgi:hypothetical protein